MFKKTILSALCSNTLANSVQEMFLQGPISMSPVTPDTTTPTTVTIPEPVAAPIKVLPGCIGLIAGT